MKHVLPTAAVAAALLLAACGGGGNANNTALPAATPNVSVPTAGPQSGTIGTLTLVIPTSSSSTLARRAQFVSPMASSAVVTVNSGSQASYDVSGTSALCTPVVGGRNCTLPIGVPFGTTSASVTLSLFTGIAGGGTLLGSGTGATTIPPNATSFSVQLDVSPIVAGVTFALNFPSTGLPRISINHVESGGTAGTATLTYTDPAGAAIPSTSTSTFAAITLSVLDPSGTVSISPLTVTNAAQPVTVSYTGGATLGASVTFNARHGTTTIGTLVSKTSGFQTNFSIGANKRPDEITVGPDGLLWFTEFTGLAIGQMDPANPPAFVEHPIPAPLFSPNPLAITAGPAGDPHVWFTIPFSGGSGALGDYGNATAPGGALTNFVTGTAGSQPVEIRSIGSNIWMSLQGLNAMRVVDVAGAPLGTFSLPAGSGPQGIALGADGNVWVTGLLNGTLHAFSATIFALLSNVAVPAGAGSEPTSIVTGPDNALWFTEAIGNGTTTYIGRLVVTPSIGTVSEFALPAPFAGPSAIAVGPDGGIWFTSGGSGQGYIVRIDPATKAFVGYPLTTTTQAEFGLVSGPDGNLWATDFSGSAIVRIQP